MPDQQISRVVNENTCITCLVLAIIFMSARTYARWCKSHRFSAEDYFAWTALSIFIMMSSVYLSMLPTLYESIAVNAGSAKPGPNYKERLAVLRKSSFATQVLFYLILWSVKFSFLTMLRPLSFGLPLYNKVWIGIATFTFLALVGCIIPILTTCVPLYLYFIPGSSCGLNKNTARLYYSLAADLTTDLTIMAIPIRLLLHVRISPLEKLGSGVISCFGLITMTCAIVRITSLNNSSAEGAIPISWLILWAVVESFVAIVVCCLPPFAIFIRKRIVTVRSGYGGSSNSGTYEARNPSHNKSRFRNKGVLLGDLGPDSVTHAYHAAAYPDRYPLPPLHTSVQTTVEAGCRDGYGKSDEALVEKGKTLDITRTNDVSITSERMETSERESSDRASSAVRENIKRESIKTALSGS